MVSAPRTNDDLLVPALYRATVRHVRRTPRRHSFTYSTFYWLTDIDAPPELARPLRALAQFDSRDHDDPRVALAQAGISADRVLRMAHARSFGHGFNPLTVYWCYRGTMRVAVVAEVHNTYGQRHSYVLRPDDAGDFIVDKALYVSPFYPVDGQYEIQVSAPDQRMAVSIGYRRGDDAPFTAAVVGDRLPVTTANLIKLWLRYPLTPWRTSALIRLQGIRLWLRRGLRVHPRAHNEAATHPGA
jgi:hypothetical protein